jgi:hypothetical protein
LAEGLPGAKKNPRSPKSRPSNSGKPKRSGDWSERTLRGRG